MKIYLFDGKYFYIYLVKYYFNKSSQSWNLMQIVRFQWEENLIGVECS
jgi:hypothetical protein